MAVTNYYSIGRRLLGECTSGVETTYMSDALGSTIGTISAAALRNRYLYTPYGSLLNKTGTDPNPRFMYNGRTQSRSTGCAYAEQYNRRRHVSSTTANWTTRDDFWPDYQAYAYADSSPASIFDPSGNSPCSGDQSRAKLLPLAERRSNFPARYRDERSIL